MTALEPEYEAALVEAAVLLRVTGRPDEGPFRRERNPLYEIGDAEARDAAFAALHGRWFEHSALDQPLRLALREQPIIAARCGRCIVARAVVPRDESAELLVTPVAPPTLFVRLRPETLSASDRALAVLRHELFHVADMLDPEFGYQPRLTSSGAGSPRDLLVRNRYRALWDALIDGRLARLGRASTTTRAERLNDVRQAFPELDDGAEAAFERFFGGPSCTHADLVAFATGGLDGALHQDCKLCGLPAGGLEPAPELLPPDVLAAIGDDFPWWSPAVGLCSRCRELYAARATAPTPAGRGGP